MTRHHRDRHIFSIDVMGTVFDIDIRDALADDVAHAHVADIEHLLRWIDDTFSPFKPMSQISRLGRGELVLAACDRRVAEVLEACERVHDLTDGFFDIRYGADGALDPCGYVKGWSVDEAVALLLERGVERFLINAGGDVRVVDVTTAPKPWRVAIVHPFDRMAIAQVVNLVHGAVATSGTAERGAHVVNPHTHAPALELSSVTVVGADLAVSDALATAAFAMGTEARRWLANLPEHDAYVIDATARQWMTEGFRRRCVDLAELEAVAP